MSCQLSGLSRAANLVLVPLLSATVSPMVHSPRGGAKGLRPLRDGRIKTGERVSLMDPGLVTLTHGTL